jgi:hypothetical protein
MRRCTHLSLAATLAALVLMDALPARASLVLALDLAELTTRADRVVVGEVLSVRSAWDRDRRHIFTTVEIQVAETWKGTPPADGRLKIVQAGGSVGDIEMRVHGMPSFTAGDRGVIFLRGTAAQTAVVGMGQGMRPLRYDAAVRRWLVDGGDRSAAVLLDGRGGTRPAPPEPTMPLADLRQKVRELLRP